MAVLTKEKILEEIAKGGIKIEPFEECQVGPASVDLTLDNTFRIFKRFHTVFEAKEKSLKDLGLISEIVQIEKGNHLLLLPHETVLGQTLEKITTSPFICGRLEGRSTFARMGLLVHISASFMQPGLNGNKQVLELSNVGNIPLAIYPGERVCQFIFEKTEGGAIYEGKFKDQQSP